MSMLVLGTVALDTVATPRGKRTNMLGGSAVHFSMSARLFTQVNLVASIGNDFPNTHIEFLGKKKIVLDALRKEEGATFKWSGEYKEDLNTAITLRTELGVLIGFTPRIAPSQNNIKDVFLANVDPEIQSVFLRSLRKPRLVGLDSMNYWIDNKRSALVALLKEVDIYVANDKEARELSGENNLIKAAKRLRSLGAKMVLIKKGEHGVLFYCDSFIFAIPAYPVEKIVDPTGAGDTFAGGFMGYLARVGKITEEYIKKACLYGTIAASFNVEGFGAERTSRLTLNEINTRLKKFKKIIRC